MLILNEFPLYLTEFSMNYSLNSYDKYFSGILNLIKNFDKKILENLEVRLYPEAFNKDIPKILKKNIPNIKLNYAKESLVKNLRDCKLCIIGDNATTLLETLRSDVPTVFFWDQRVVKNRDLAENLFDKMYEQKLFYKNSEKLAEFCNQNYDNIYQWWQNEDRQDLIKKFLKNFASKDDSKIKNLYEIIEKNI